MRRTLESVAAQRLNKIGKNLVVSTREDFEDDINTVSEIIMHGNRISFASFVTPITYSVQGVFYAMPSADSRFVFVDVFCVYTCTIKLGCEAQLAAYPYKHFLL